MNKGKSLITGIRTGRYTRAHPPLGFLNRKDLLDGRLLALRIDLYYPKEEILKRVGEIYDVYKKASSGDHAAGKRTSKEKRPGTLWERRWEVWDTYVDSGGEDIRRTAEILFPAEFQTGDDRKEMKAEARKEMNERINRGENPVKVETWYDNRIGRATAAKWRIEKRDRIVKSLRPIIDFCRKAIASHEPMPSRLSSPRR